MGRNFKCSSCKLFANNTPVNKGYHQGLLLWNLYKCRLQWANKNLYNKKHQCIANK